MKTNEYEKLIRNSQLSPWKFSNITFQHQVEILNFLNRSQCKKDLENLIKTGQGAYYNFLEKEICEKLAK